MFNKSDQTQGAGDNAILIQAGRDINLVVTKSPPRIKLVRILTMDDSSDGCLKQRITIVLKNNGDHSAVLLEGRLIVERRVEITDCSAAQYSLIKSDWTYDVDLESPDPKFVGRHALAPNEVISFDALAARKFGGHEITIYRCRLELTFDEGGNLETESFFLRIAGPTSVRGSYSPGQSADMWGRCMADNIRKLDSIGYDLRPFVDKSSKKHIVSVAPELFAKPR